MATQRERLDEATTDRLYDDLYETYGEPLEIDCHGQYLAISPAGDTVLGPCMLRVAEEAADKLGHGVFLYRIGMRTVGNWK